MGIRAELEEEQTWRRDEIRFLRNQIANLQSDTERDMYRRSLVVMLYAHYEGFCKAALLQYVRVVNAAGLTCGDATPAIVASSWIEIFRGIENTQSKSAFFKAKLPDDTQLHRFARRREFVEQIANFERLRATIPEQAVDVEDNLSPIVMKKVLYKIGVDHDAFVLHDGDILHLLNRRNNISHGVERKGVDESSYVKLETSVFRIMDDLMDLVIGAIRSEHYRRQPP